MQKGNLQDAAYIQYWKTVDENEYYASNIYVIRIDGNEVELAIEFDEHGIYIPITDFIDVLNAWQSFLMNN